MSDNLLLYISSIICALLTIYQIFNRQKRAGILSAIVLCRLLSPTLLPLLLSFRIWSRSHMVVLSSCA